MKTATAHGQTFVYEDSGSGPLVALFHGFPDTPGGWDEARDVLNGAGYRTVIPYLRGYHPDTLVEGRGYASDEIGGDAIRLLDAIGEDSAVLVGHDWGAAIAYRAAALAPERVTAVCGVGIPHPLVLKPSPALLWGGRHFITLRLPSGSWLARRNDFAYEDALMRRWAPDWSGPGRDRALADVKKAFADPEVLDAALGYYRAIDPREVAPRISQPGLVVGGTNDIAPAALFERSPEGFDGPCEVVIADGAGHWPHREAADLFHERLLAWLGALG